MNKRGLNIIISSEGCKLKPYLDPKGIPTIGYGTTIYPNGAKVKMTDKQITKEQAYEFLLFDLNKTEKQILSYIKQELSENQISALVSFTYNVGIGNLIKSTLLKKINLNPNDESIKDEFMRWIKITKNGKKIVLNGLVIRRMKESKLYFSQN